MTDVKNVFTLHNKIIVITGASGLLGQKHAEAISAHGGVPVLLDLSQQKVDALADKLNKRYNV